jgi:hypothetical protein
MSQSRSGKLPALTLITRESSFNGSETSANISDVHVKGIPETPQAGTCLETGTVEARAYPNTVASHGKIVIMTESIPEENNTGCCKDLVNFWCDQGRGLASLSSGLGSYDWYLALEVR